MFTRRNTDKPKEKDVSLLLVPFILACFVTILTSLYIAFRPFTWSDIRRWAAAGRTYAVYGSYVLMDVIDAMERKCALERPPLLSLAEGLAPTKEIPFLESSGQMGSTVGTDPASIDTLDAIYIAMLDTGAGPMLYYHQGDRRWKDYLYGGKDPMGRYGCGPTAVSMLVNSFSASPATPVELAEWAYENRCYAPQSGSYHKLIPEALAAYGFSVESVTDRSPENVSALLQSGHLMVALMGHGSLTKNGHFVLFTQLLDNGNIRIADPANYENCAKEWDLKQLLSELKKSYDSGGPLWAVQP